MKKLEYIARIHTDFPTKFGIPRQSGLVSTKGTIVFEPEYRKEEALKGLEEYSHLWLIWEFSEVVRENWSPTVRPPRLGGNKRCGVFATRSPFRPNPIGLSCVRLLGIEKRPEKGMVVEVEGAISAVCGLYAGCQRRIRRPGEGLCAGGRDTGETSVKTSK